LMRAVPGGMRDFAMYMNEESRDAFRSAGLSSVSSGRSGFVEAFGEEHFAWHEHHSEMQQRFDAVMMSLTPVNVAPLLGDWKPPAANSTVCDIGGGQGHLLAKILQQFPETRGWVADQSSVVNRSSAFLKSRGLGDRGTAVAADLLAPMPQELVACDVFVLKLILHDWADAQTVAILRNIAQIARPGARLDIVDRVLGEGSAIEINDGWLQDLHMHANHGAKERTLAEFQDVVRRAGLQSEVQPTRLRAAMWLLQVVL